MGFNIDASVTGDVARILRVPDTHNYKEAKPRKVAIKVKGSIFNFEALSNHLREAVGEQSYESLPPLQLPGQRPKLAPNANSVKLIENSATFFKNIKTCAQINYYKEHATEDGMEPLWRGVLSIAKYCDDGEEEGLAISAMHPYDTGRHNEKWHAIKGPYGCLKFDEANPGVCETCPHYNKFTNPLSLGREIKVDVEQKEVVVERVQEEEAVLAPQTITRPTPPKGFAFGSQRRCVYGQNGGRRAGW
jgi:hypothetical protein